MRHDYDLPPEWDGMDDAARSRWLTQERCRRQAAAQDTVSSEVIKEERENFVVELNDEGWLYLKSKR
jgi:hypothetical protein